MGIDKRIACDGNYMCVWRVDSICMELAVENHTLTTLLNVKYVELGHDMSRQNHHFHAFRAPHH